MRDENSAPAPIALCGDLTQFFRDIIAAVKRLRTFNTSAATETYIAALLADNACAPVALNSLDKPLSLQFSEAMSQIGNVRFAQLRKIGDGVLYTTGFFGEHLERRGLEQGYVEEIGARAYATAGKMMLLDSNTGNDLFDELSRHFHLFVSLVYEVRNTLTASAAKSQAAVLQLYEQWLTSHSDALASALASRGLVPLRGTGTVQ
jgi:hypothetical protein